MFSLQNSPDWGRGRPDYQPERYQHGRRCLGLSSVRQLLLLPHPLPLREFLPGAAELPQHQADVREGPQGEAAGQLLLS